MVGPLLDRHVAEGRGDTPALRMAQRQISYGELQELVNRAGNALRDAGVEPEQRVAILVHDGPEFVAAFLGAMKIGAVPVPMNTSAPPNELQVMSADCRGGARRAKEGGAWAPGKATSGVGRVFCGCGLAPPFFLRLLAAAPSFLPPDPPAARHTLEVVQRYRSTLFFSVPTSYAQICAALE